MAGEARAESGDPCYFCRDEYWRNGPREITRPITPSPSCSPRSSISSNSGRSSSTRGSNRSRMRRLSLGVEQFYAETHRSWIEKVFQKRECVKFLPTKADPLRCGCGQALLQHGPNASPANGGGGADDHDYWSPAKNTQLQSTDAFGVIEFQGGPHSIKAQFVRVAHDTPSDLILQLLTKEWDLELPKLLISIHGGKANFDLQPKLKTVLRKGLVRAARTTGAWIFTGGANTGVMRHVGEALTSERTPHLHNRVISIGIAPWGIIENRHQLLGRDTVVQYHSNPSSKSRFAALNNYHSYFILADNGTVGKYGAEIGLRKRLEKLISQQKIFSCVNAAPRPPALIAGLLTPIRLPQAAETRSNGVPVVCVVIEGGTNTIRSVLEYVTDSPSVPVVVCDGSGRAADLLAFAHKYLRDDGTLPEMLRDQLLVTITKTFECPPQVALQLHMELIECVRRKELITIFRMGEEPCQELDQAILASLLKGSRLSAPDQLSLAMAWNRVDVAHSEIFVLGQDWAPGSLEQAMMEALVYDRVDFVKLLLENGVNMRKFLTIPRLEELYNTKLGPSNTLRYLIRDVKKNIPSCYRYTLYDIGLVFEQLMGGAYRSAYCRRRFRHLYNNLMGNKTLPSLHRMSLADPLHRTLSESEKESMTFQYPFNELLVWAVLMKRQQMASFIWQHGEEAIAKALVACRLYKAMASEASQDDLEADISEELRKNAREFEDLGLELLDYCYREDENMAQQLLTYELQNWSKHTCLSLAWAANHRAFLAHTCCQILLADLWMGGLRMRRNTNIKVILGLLWPPFIFTLEFKSKEELQQQPQTEEEYMQALQEMYEKRTSRTGLDSDEQDVNQEQSCQLSPDKVENGGAFSDLNHPDPSEMHPEKQNKKPLRLGRKIYEFYAAPVTKFWAHTIAYTVFLFFFTYVVLVRMSQQPNSFEYHVILYLFSLGAEKIRELIISEPVTFNQKLIVWSEKKWNPCDVVLVVFFFVGFSLRINPSTQSEGRVIYCVDIMYWYIRILDILSVNKYLGPFVTMIGKMVVTMIYFVVLLAVVLMAFGVARQAILFPDEDPSWHLARNIFFMPYWMIYGEVFADEIDPPCGEGTKNPCRTGRWITPAAMSIYLLIANVLLINLLIAIFNHIFQEVNAISQQIWKFQRFSVVMEYEQKPMLPPPFIMLNHLYLLAVDCFRRLRGKKRIYDHSLKLFLFGENLQKAHDFEEECIDGYFQEKQNRVQMSTEDRVRHTNDRVEVMAQKLEDVYYRENLATVSLQTLDLRLTRLEEVADQTVNSLHRIQHSLDLQHQLTIDSMDYPSFYDSQMDRQPSEDIAEDTEDEDVSPPMTLPTSPEPPSVSTSVIHQRRRLHRRLQRSMKQTSVDQEVASERIRPPPKITLRSMSTTQSEPDTSFLAHPQAAQLENTSTEPALHVPPASGTSRPRLGATRNVYTSITDELESSCLLNPTPSLRRLGSSSSDTEQFLQAEAQILHNAELADYQRMEGLIQRRLHRNSENLTTSLEDLNSASYDVDSDADGAAQQRQHQPQPPSPDQDMLDDASGLSSSRCSSFVGRGEQLGPSNRKMPLRAYASVPLRKFRAETQC